MEDCMENRAVKSGFLRYGGGGGVWRTKSFIDVLQLFHKFADQSF
jgi:hypothetical protein